MLPLLFGFEVKTSKPSEVLLADSLIDSCSSLDALSVVISRIGPPVSLRLDISDDHVLNSGR